MQQNHLKKHQTMVLSLWLFLWRWWCWLPFPFFCGACTSRITNSSAGYCGSEMPICHRLMPMFLLWKKASSFLILREMTAINWSELASSHVFRVKLYDLQWFSPSWAFPQGTYIQRNLHSHWNDCHRGSYLGELSLCGRMKWGCKAEPLRNWLLWGKPGTENTLTPWTPNCSHGVVMSEAPEQQAFSWNFFLWDHLGFCFVFICCRIHSWASIKIWPWI